MEQNIIHSTKRRHVKSRFAQTQNPRTGHWVQIDREKGKIIAWLKKKKKGVPVARKKRNNDEKIKLCQ